MRLDLLAVLNAERDARRAAIVVTDFASGTQRLVKAADTACDPLRDVLSERLGFELDRLHRSCRRLIWLNPLLRYDAFEARAKGVLAMLPHVDEVRPVHNLASLGALAEALAHDRPSAHIDPKRWLSRAA